MIRFRKIDIILLWVSILGSSINNYAQDTLSLEQAIQIGLQNNYQILVARNNTEIALNNNSLGNAGFLPRITASGSSNNTQYSSITEDFDGTRTEYDPSDVNALSANITLNWTIFDGFEMFIRKSSFEKYQQISEIQLRMEVENLISEITGKYCGIVQQQKRLKILENAMNFSNKRKELAQAKFRLGSASELNYLQALVDLNADSIALIRQINQIKNSKSELNNFLARDIFIEYIIEDSITVDSVLVFSEIMKRIGNGNSSILLARSSLDLSMMDYRLSHSPKYPQINFFAGYNFSNSRYESGTNKIYQYMGPVYGITLSFDIFNGFNYRRNSANSKILINNSKTELDQTISDIQTAFYTLFNDYQTNMDLIKFEMENIKAARRTTFVAYERYKLGEISDIELRQTQLKQLEAENQLLLAEYQVKLLETELLRLCGRLIQDE